MMTTVLLTLALAQDCPNGACDVPPVEARAQRQLVQRVAAAPRSVMQRQPVRRLFSWGRRPFRMVRCR
jgi:hypothetical protein